VASCCSPHCLAGFPQMSNLEKAATCQPGRELQVGHSVQQRIKSFARLFDLGLHRIRSLPSAQVHLVPSSTTRPTHSCTPSLFKTSRFSSFTTASPPSHLRSHLSHLHRLFPVSSVCLAVAALPSPVSAPAKLLDVVSARHGAGGCLLSSVSGCTSPTRLPTLSRIPCPG